VRVSEGVLLAPLVGNVDSARADSLMKMVLEHAEAENTRVVILDVAGVPVMDTAAANSLITTARALRLLGTQVILTGISASTAKTVINLGIDMSVLETRNRLSDGIALAQQLIDGGRSP
jgi:rsbT co-antagonist protein RsbR